MVKVLLVDDERLALEYLEHVIDWDYYGFQLIGVTTDPEQALNLYKKFHPELVISDVKMPGMNGLELVNAIREYGGESHILFLSAYKNFDYVKQAIRLNIDDYMLKSNLEEVTFLKKILKLKDETDKEKAKSSYTRAVILKELFKKNIPEESYKLMLDDNDYYYIQKSYYYLILTQHTAPRFIYQYIPQKETPLASFEFQFSDICHHYGQDDIKVVSIFEINEQEYLAVLELSGNMISQKEINDKIFYYARTIYNEMNRGKENQFNLYYYNRKMSPRQFGRFYNEHKSQLSQRYIKRQPYLDEFGKNKISENPEDVVPSITSEEIYQFIKQENDDKIQECIQTIKTAVKEEDHFTYLWYVKNMFEAIHAFEGKLRGIRSGRFFAMAEGSLNYDLRNPDDLIGYLEYKLKEIRYINAEQKESVYSNIISGAIGYIQENYWNSGLSSALVAQSVNISASWLSTKFKEEVGIGVNDFINNIRIEKAKSLIEKEDHMVYEISEKVGYTSSQYFSKIFKSFVGVTPNQYRREMIDKGKRDEAEA